MADTKISALTDGGNLQVGDELAIARASTSYRAVALMDGWVDDTGETWTYASGSGGGVATFTVPGDQTAKFTAGTRIKLTQTTVKYFVVTKDATVAAGTTTVTIMAGTDYTLANAAISANFYSYAANPQGYPTWFNFTTGVTGFSSTTTNSARFSVIGRVMTVKFSVQGTSNATSVTITLPISTGTGTFHGFSDFNIRIQNAGTFAAGLAEATDGSATVSCFATVAGGNFTNTGTKSVSGVLVLEI